MSDTAGNQAYVGQREFPTTNSPYNTLEFLFRVLAGGFASCTLVRVEAVTPGPDLKPGTVDVQLLINQQDAVGNNTPHGVIYSLPFSRIQAGAVGLIVDPAPGDIGVAVFASRDISAAKAAKNVERLQSRDIDSVSPGSFRQLDYSDGIYLFSCLSSKTPTSYIQIPQDGSIQSLCPKTFQQTGEFLVTESVAAKGNLSSDTAATGTFTSADGKVITVIAGIVTGIA